MRERSVVSSSFGAAMKDREGAMSCGPRIARERRTIATMVQIYCRDHHRPAGGLCADCGQLLGYAWQRLENCPFQEDKPACNLCAVHCYSGTQRECARAVMRYAGPRMLVRHPIQSLFHMLDTRRPVPKLATRKKG